MSIIPMWMSDGIWYFRELKNRQGLHWITCCVLLHHWLLPILQRILFWPHFAVIFLIQMNCQQRLIPQTWSVKFLGCLPEFWGSKDRPCTHVLWNVHVCFVIGLYDTVYMFSAFVRTLSVCSKSGSMAIEPLAKTRSVWGEIELGQLAISLIIGNWT